MVLSSLVVKELTGMDFQMSGYEVFSAYNTNLNLLQEYDFNNQFWSEVNVFSSPSPLPRWGASGGIDISTPPVQDPLLSGPNNTLYLTGGSNDTRANSLSDVWRLHISGTLSSNLPNDTFASWDRLTIGNLPARVGSAGTVISQQLVAVGGCNSTSPLDCTQAQDSYVLNVQSQQDISPKPCAAPRASPVLVANMNSFSTSFSSQAFLLLGILNTSEWEDDNGLARGEVVRCQIFCHSTPINFSVRPCLISTEALGAEFYLQATLEHLVVDLHFPPPGQVPRPSHIRPRSWVWHAVLLRMQLCVTTLFYRFRLTYVPLYRYLAAKTLQEICCQRFGSCERILVWSQHLVLGLGMGTAGFRLASTLMDLA
jgi:hypothetical protein